MKASGTASRFAPYAEAAVKRKRGGRTFEIVESAAPSPPLEGVECDCGKDAVKWAWFVQLSVGHVTPFGKQSKQEEVVGSLPLCEQCAADLAAMDARVSFTPIEKRYLNAGKKG